METYSSIRQDLSSLLDQNNLDRFLEALGRQTRSARCLIYRPMPDGDSIVLHERALTDVSPPAGSASPSSLTFFLDDRQTVLAIQRWSGSYSPSENELFQLAGSMLQEQRLRSTLEARCRALEEQLEAAKIQAEASTTAARAWEQKCQAIDAYARGLTHQCLTQSQSLGKLTASLSKDTGFCPPIVREKFAKLEAVVNRGTELAEALLQSTKARAASGQAGETIVLAELFNEVRLDLKGLVAPCQAQLERTSLPTVVGDRTLWKSLLTQLISNSLLYRTGQPRIHLEASSTEDQQRLTIRDNGPGIPTNLREAVFSPFRRLHTADEVPGVGLGLTLCREIVTQMGGKIWLGDNGSEPGLCVHIALPRSRAERNSP